MPQYLNVMVKGTMRKNTCCGRAQAYNVGDFLTQYSIMQIVLKITMYGDIKMSCHKICLIVKIQDGNMFKLRSNNNIKKSLIQRYFFVIYVNISCQRCFVIFLWLSYSITHTIYFNGTIMSTLLLKRSRVRYLNSEISWTFF